MRADASSRNVTYRQLTSRQADCAELAAKGLTSKEIARELNISPSTVDTHISSVLARYNLNKRSDLSLLFQSSDKNIDENSYILTDENSNRLHSEALESNSRDTFQIASRFLVANEAKIYILGSFLAILFLSFFAWHYLN